MESMTFRELTDKMMLLYTEGKYADALQLVEQNADGFPEQAARTTFWKLCLLSLCHRSNDVMSVFRQGLDAGLWWSARQFEDSDLDAVRELPEFKRLMAVSQEKYEEARTRIERDHTLLLPEPPALASGTYPLLIALHGHNGTKSSDLEHWEAARQKGWLVLSAQSTQPTYSGSYGWDDPAQGLADLLFYYEQVSQQYQIDPQRVVLAGFSQGSGMAIYAALKGNLPVRGFIGIGTWWPDASELASERKGLRAYFVTGEKDQTFERAREIQDTLKRNNVQIAEEVHPDLGHAFPADFGPSFDKAIQIHFGVTEVNVHKVIQSQYLAALAMFKQVIANCPQSVWDSTGDKFRFWSKSYHVLFYTHLYLQRAEKDFVPWEKHHDPDGDVPFTKDEVLEYLSFVEKQVLERVPDTDLEAESGFHWYPVNKLELQFINIRHIQQHTGELYESLGTRENIELGWVGSSQTRKENE